MRAPPPSRLLGSIAWLARFTSDLKPSTALNLIRLIFCKIQPGELPNTQLGPTRGPQERPPGTGTGQLEASSTHWKQTLFSPTIHQHRSHWPDQLRRTGARPLAHCGALPALPVAPPSVHISGAYQSVWASQPPPLPHFLLQPPRHSQRCPIWIMRHRSPRRRSLSPHSTQTMITFLLHLTARATFPWLGR